MSTINETYISIAYRSDQAISLNDLRHSGKALLDRVASGEQDKYVVTNGKKTPVYVILPIDGDMGLNHVDQIISTNDLRCEKEILNRFTSCGQRKYIVMRKNKPIGVVRPICGMETTLYELEGFLNKS